jgi:hypothetical protein
MKTLSIEQIQVSKNRNLISLQNIVNQANISELVVLITPIAAGFYFSYRPAKWEQETCKEMTNYLIKVMELPLSQQLIANICYTIDGIPGIAFDLYKFFNSLKPFQEALFDQYFQNISDNLQLYGFPKLQVN